MQNKKLKPPKKSPINKGSPRVFHAKGALVPIRGLVLLVHSTPCTHGGPRAPPLPKAMFPSLPRASPWGGGAGSSPRGVMEVGCTPKTPRVCGGDTHGAQAGARKGTGSWQHGRPCALHPPTRVGAHPVITASAAKLQSRAGASLPPIRPPCLCCLPPQHLPLAPPFWGRGAQPHYEHPRDTAWRFGVRGPQLTAWCGHHAWHVSVGTATGRAAGWGRPATPQRAVPTGHSQKGWRRGRWAMERLRKQGDVPLGGPLCPPGAGGGLVTAVPPHWGWALGTASCCHCSGEPGLSTSCARPPKEVRPCPL